MLKSEVLNGAADHVGAFGLAKHKLHGKGPRETAPACSLGALVVAAGAQNLEGDAVQAAVAFQRYLDPTCEVNIAGWNNAPERTAEDVVAALRAAAAVEELKEAEARGPLNTGPTVRVPTQPGVGVA